MLNNQQPIVPVLIEDLGFLFPTETSKRKSRYGIFKCSCGNEFKAITSNITSKTTNSCGCYQKKQTSNANTKHGMNNHKLYTVWGSIMQRVNNENYEHFEDYGGRGITVCDRWLDVRNFIEDMYESYRDGLSIDRINPNGNYEPLNCRWSTKIVQARNTRVLRKDNTSGYRGVVFDKDSGKWTSKICIFKKIHYLGRFDTAIEAAIAYDSYVIDNKLEHTINLSSNCSHTII